MYKIFKLKCIYYFFSKMENINNKLKLKIIKLFFHYQGDSMKLSKRLQDHMTLEVLKMYAMMHVDEIGFLLT